MPPVTLIELLIFAVLAAVVLYNLYAVLGRRIGRQPGEATGAPQPGAPADANSQRGPQRNGSTINPSQYLPVRYEPGL